MELMELIHKRYSAKVFDTTKKISDEDMKKIEEMLQMAASSTNVQPWHFVIATTQAGKDRICKATEGFYSFNKNKVEQASAVVVFATRVDITDEYLDHVSDKEEADGRYAQPQFKQDNHLGRQTFVNFHKYDFKDLRHWCDKQVYLNLGSFLLGIKELGIDAVAMEGVDMSILDQQLGLREKGFASTVVVPIGYHAKEDFNAELPKSRLSKEEIIEYI